MEAFIAGPLKRQAAAPMEDKKPAKAASKTSHCHQRTTQGIWL
jgi:hypothetical protein